MRTKHKAKFRSEGGRDETTAFPPLQPQMEAGHKCQSDSAEALWALSQLPGGTKLLLSLWLQSLFTAPELSVSLGSEGGGSAAALSSCRGSWHCPSQTEVVFPFCLYQWHKGIFSPKILHNLCNFWTQSRECCSCVWGGGMAGSQELCNFFMSIAQCERWPAPFLSCNGVTVQQIGREFKCLFPFGIHLLCFPLCELSLPWRVCLSHGEAVGDWMKHTQIVVTIAVKCFALRLLYHVSALSHCSHQKCNSVLRMWKWALASGLWRCSQLIFSTALFLLVLSSHSMIPGPVVSPAGGHDVPTEILWFVAVSILWMWVLWHLWPQIVIKSCVLSLLWWMNRRKVVLWLHS